MNLVSFGKHHQCIKRSSEMHIISCLFFYVYLVFELKFIILKEAFNKLGNGGIMILKEIHIFIALTDIHTLGSADKS